jgi:CheY-like chemotaxis protein
MNILIVEDHIDTADVLGRVLRKLGHAPTIVNTCRDAEAALASSAAFVVALVDVTLQDGCGLDLMPRLRELGVKGVALSGHDADTAQSKAAGFTFHLRKPVDVADLIVILR